MGFIIIDKIKNNNKKIMVFTEGTILKPKYNNFFSRIAMTKFVTVGNAIDKLRTWQEQGYEIVYLTSARGKKALDMAKRLVDLGFEGSRVVYRDKDQEYSDILNEELPDFFIEDDCKSVGGKSEICFKNLNKECKEKIKHILVNEFQGIDSVELYKN